LVAAGAATVNSAGPVNNIGRQLPALISVVAGCNAPNSILRSAISFEQEFISINESTAAIINNFFISVIF
jgi:hypothetical protein